MADDSGGLVAPQPDAQETLLDVSLGWAWSAARLRDVADRDPTSLDAQRWNDCVTSLERAHEALCVALFPHVEGAGAALRFSASHGDREFTARAVQHAFQRGFDSEQ